PYTLARLVWGFMGDIIRSAYKKNKPFINYVLYIVIFSVILFFYVYQHIKSLRYGYKVEEQRKLLYQVQMENDQIGMEIKQFTSLPRLEELAKKKLGLKIADQSEIITLPVERNKKNIKKNSFIDSLSQLLKK
ncbi:MAG: hypothetical protein ABII23_02040, partial [bacterium]